MLIDNGGFFLEVLRGKSNLAVADARPAEERLEAPERTDEEVGRRDEAREIRVALEGLPSEQSHVIELAYYGGFSHSEIATMLDTPIGTVKGRMRLGLQKMRLQLGAAGVLS